MSERWLPVVGWEGLYEVSDLGRVRSLDRVLEQTDARGGGYQRHFSGRFLKYKYCAKGPYGRWCTVCLGRGAEGSPKYLLVSRMVLTAFVGECPAGMEAAHNDGNPENNKLNNLRWDTHSNNQLDITKHGRHGKSPRRWSPFTVEDVLKTRATYAEAGWTAAKNVIGMSDFALCRVLNLKGRYSDYLLRNFGLTV